MKRLGLIMMSVALVLGMAQCKKNVEPVTTTVVNGGTIELKVKTDGGKAGDSKISVVPGPITAVVSFEDGDLLHVASDGHYLGTIEYDASAETFSGEIATPTTGVPLQLFFLAGQDPDGLIGNTTEGSTSCTIDISDQTTDLAVLSCGATENYTTSDVTYTAKLKNKCALVKFNTNVESSNITINGLYTTASIDFSAGTITNNGTTGGVSISTDGSGVGYAILLPQEGFTADVSALYNVGTCTMPTTTVNMYYNAGVDVELTEIEGIVKGVFTVNSSGKQVYFGNGNVECVEGVYSFASTQWTDHSGDKTMNKYYFNNDQARSAVTGLNNANYLGRNDWILLTMAEWTYVINQRTTVDGTAGNDHNWKWITISDVTQTGNSNSSMKGVLLFPDGYGSVTGVSTTQTMATLAVLHANGCVFLPAAGYVYENTFYNIASYVMLRTSTWGNSYNSAPYVRLSSSGAYLGGKDNSYGNSLRMSLSVQ